MITGNETADVTASTPATNQTKPSLPGRVRIDKVVVDLVTMEGAVERIGLFQAQHRVRAAQVVTVNAQFVQIASHSKHFADLIARAELSVADGVPLVWASRLLGDALPARVNGADLMVRLCQEAAANGQSVYFLGGMPGAAEATAQILQKTCPGLRVAGVHCPAHGFLQGDLALQQEVARRITDAKPDLLFVALGAPAQEYWIERNAHLPVKVMMGVGGSFELVAGFQKRAPLLLQNAGFEWLWRLAREPRRLWRRYLFGNTLFIYLVLRQLLQNQPHAAPAQIITQTIAQTTAQTTEAVS